MTQHLIARSGYWSTLGHRLNAQHDVHDSSAFVCKAIRLICDNNWRRRNSPLAVVGALSNPRSFASAEAGLSESCAELASRLGLVDAALVRDRCYVGGAWVEAARDGPAARFPVHDPATRDALLTVPDFDAPDALAAIDAAKRSQKAWAQKTAAARATLLRRWHDLILEHREDLAKIMVAEQGKPRKEAEAEVTYAASFVEWFSEEARRTYGEVIPSHDGDSRMFALRQPVGVVAAICPWNFPCAMVTRKAAAAMAAGCCVVVKPSEETPLSALALAALAERAGVPGGVLNVITGADADAVVGALADSKDVRALSFTGSTEVGKSLGARCAKTVKKTSLELGGNAPFVVLADADLDAAIEGALRSKFRNGGQTCVCAQRFIVHASLADRFAEGLADRAERLKIGIGSDPATEVGPMINQDAVEKVERHVTDALAKGARRVTGGKRAYPDGTPTNGTGTFYAPTVLANCDASMAVHREETFGPVAAVFSFETEREAIAMANDSDSGLAGYVYTRDGEAMWRVAEALECGIVGANTGAVSVAAAPFGGVKESGIGREGGRQGIDEYLEVKYLCMNNTAPKKA